MKDNEVTSFLKKVLSDQKDKFTMYDNLHGEITINDSDDKIIGGNSKVHLSTGSVYGIFAIKQESSNVEELFEEVKNNVNAIDDNNTIYPIYWGKDIKAGSRIPIHVRPNPNTGNAKLEEINKLRNFKLIYGCVFVTNYKEFEKYLHDTYPPLIGTSQSGKGSKITVIDN